MPPPSHEHSTAHSSKPHATQRAAHTPRWLAVTFSIAATLLVGVAVMLVSSYFSMNGAPSSAAGVGGKKSNDTCLTPNEKFFAPVLKSLLEQNADTSFVRLLVNDPRTAFNETLVKVNVVGQRKKADYSHNYTEQAVRSTQEFIFANDSLLTAAETQYAIPKEIISALMYVETKHGQITGLHHVASVYLSVAMSTQPEYIEKNKQAMREKFDGTEDEAQELEGKIEQRAAKKAVWAVKELLAMDKMRSVSPIPVMELYGSWAGAFGWSQFLPSSYMKLAVDGSGDGRVNLFDVRDAVHSVGNYLRAANWSDDKAAQRRAIYSYNNSDDYVSAILALARKAGDGLEKAKAKAESKSSAKPSTTSSVSKSKKKTTASKSSKSSKRSRSKKSARR